MLVAGLLLALVSSARALPVLYEPSASVAGIFAEVACEFRHSWWPCSIMPFVGNKSGQTLATPYTHSNHKRQEPTASGSQGPALGTILGGVFGALGGLAVIGAILYAWWAIRRVERNRAAHERNASSSFGAGATHSQLVGQQASKDSRGSSSNKSRQSRKKRPGAKWQDPWLASPKSPRTTPVAVKLDRPAGAVVSGSGMRAVEDRTSESVSVPLEVIVSNVDDEHKVVHDGL